jgi:hypothetical protein
MNKMKTILGIGIVAGSLALAAPALASDVVLGAVLGGGAGALIGQSLGGRDGAIIGSAIGAAAGASAASSTRYYSASGRSVVVHHAPPAPVYHVPAPVYYAPPAVVYHSAPVYRPAPVRYVAPRARHRPAPVVVDHRGRGHWQAAQRGSGANNWKHQRVRPHR